MYAIVNTGGKQYRVEPGDMARVECLLSVKAHPSLLSFRVNSCRSYGYGDSALSIQRPGYRRGHWVASVLVGDYELLRDDGQFS